MNRNRRPMANKKRKSLEKEIKEGQKQLYEKEPLIRTDTLTTKKALKQYPPKRQKVEKPLMEAVVKEMQKKKKDTKHSKRSTPGDVEHRESPPAHVHPENERWIKTLAKQNKNQRKNLTAKLQRRKGKK